MSDKTKEVPQLDDLTYAHTLVIKSTHDYKVHEPYARFQLLTYLVFRGLEETEWVYGFI